MIHTFGYLLRAFVGAIVLVITDFFKDVVVHFVLKTFNEPSSEYSVIMKV